MKPAIGYTITDTQRDWSSPALTGLKKYYLTFHAYAMGSYGWSKSIPLSEVPSDVFAMGHEALVSSEWAAPHISAAMENFIVEAKKSMTAMESAIRDIEVFN